MDCDSSRDTVECLWGVCYTRGAVVGAATGLRGISRTGLDSDCSAWVHWRPAVNTESNKVMCEDSIESRKTELL